MNTTDQQPSGLAVAPCSAWLDIAIAPKDGTNILATDGEIIALVWWSEEWRDYGDIGAGGRYDFSPKHWMHLPPLPNVEISHDRERKI